MARPRAMRAFLCIVTNLFLLPSPVVSFFNSYGQSPGYRMMRHRSSHKPSCCTLNMSTQQRSSEVSTDVDSEEKTRDLASLQIGERLKGIVVEELDGTTGKKAWVRLGVTRRAKGGTLAYVDGMIRLNKEKGLKPKKVAIDRPVTVFVKEVVIAEGRLEVSLRAPKMKATREQLDALRPLAGLQIGQELQGTIVSVTQYAAFVSCGIGRPTRRIGPDGRPALLEEEHGFLAKEDLLEDVALSEQLVKSQDIKRVMGKGDRVKVYVKEVKPSNGRYKLTMDEAMTPEKAEMLKRKAERQRAKFSRRRDAADLEVGEEILGDIVKAFEFGFFVDVGAKTNGLVHISSISKMEDRYIQNLDDFAQVGDKLYVRVNGLNDQKRLSLDFVAREVDRPTGPNRRKRRSGERGEQVEQAAAVESKEGGDDLFDDFWDADSSGRGSRNSAVDDGDSSDGYTSNLNYDDFDM